MRDDDDDAKADARRKGACARDERREGASTCARGRVRRDAAERSNDDARCR
jgi:hypothetical protein